MSDETQDSARQLERVPFRHSLAEVDEIQNPYFIGAPGMNRTCDLRFRKPLLYPLSYEGGDGAKCGAKLADTPCVIYVEVTGEC